MLTLLSLSELDYNCLRQKDVELKYEERKLGKTGPRSWKSKTCQTADYLTTVKFILKNEMQCQVYNQYQKVILETTSIFSKNSSKCRVVYKQTLSSVFHHINTIIMGLLFLDYLRFT